jgi:hypothetical protein
VFVQQQQQQCACAHRTQTPPPNKVHNIQPTKSDPMEQRS